ncbi:hypothetical protein FKM82_009195 [Ascaphus truei]
MDKPNENMSDHLCNQRTTADTSHDTLHLTVENVMRLEQEHASAEGFLPERSVEDYMRRTHQLSLEEGQKSSDITEATPLAKAPSDIPTQSMEEHEADSQINDMNNTVNEVSGDENKRETQASNTSTPSNDSIAKKIRIERPATSEVFITGHTLDGREFVAICDQTQTEWSDLETSSTNSSTIVFFTTENLIAEKSVSSHSEYEVERGESERRHEAASKRYYTGQSFLLLFPDGTGQVLYPSGTMGILFACSKPVQITFIILEDVKRKPQIRAVFMSNGHAACYHLNGMLWIVLDPWGGSYFDDNGILQKHWKWWDWSPHVHAPPFQSITLKLNANIEVKFLTQDQIHVTFSRKEENVTFNVGSNLMLKDPEKSTLLKPKIGEREFYLCSKKFQIYNLLKNISKLVRMPNGHQSRTEKIEDCVIQLQESLNNIRRHTSKEIDQGIFQAYSAEVLPCEASLSIKIVPKKKHRFTHDHQQDEPHTNRNRSANTETDQKDTDKVKKKKTKKKRTSNQVT